MNKNQATKRFDVVEQLIKVLADNQITYSEASGILNDVNTELDHLSQRQTIRV